MSEVRAQFWNGTTGQLIRGNSDAQLLALYLMTCPASNQTGLFSIAKKTIKHDTGITDLSIERAMELLVEVGFVAYDLEKTWVWVIEMLRFQVGPTLKPTDKRVIGLQRYLDDHAGMPFIHDFIAKYAVTHNVVYNPPKPPPPPPKPINLLFDIEGEPEPEPPKAPDLTVNARIKHAKEIRLVFEHYKKYFPKKFKVINAGTTEWRSISCRLKDGLSVSELCAAIDGMMRSPWHQGKNPTNIKYDSLNLVVRSNKQVYMFIDIPLEAAPVLSDKNRTTVDAVQARIQSRTKKPTTPPPPPISRLNLPHELDPFHPSLKDDYDAAR